MGLLHAIHFDAAVAPPEVTLAGGSSYIQVSTTVKRTGTHSLRISCWTTYFDHKATLALSAPLSEFYLQFGFYFTNAPSGNSRILKWESSGGTVLGGLGLNASTQKLELYTGNFASLVATGSTVLNTGQFYVIELYVKIDDSGQLTLRVDMIGDAAFTGDTKPGADTAVASVIFGNLYLNITSQYAYLDDIIVHDTTGTRNNSWPDGGKVAYLLPDGDGSNKEWTPSAGSDHYALIDEVPPSDMDYLHTTAVDKVTEVTLANLPGNAQAVQAVIGETYAFKDSSTEPTQIALGIDVGGGANFSSDKSLGTSAGLVRNIWEEKPGGGNFSVSDINSMKFLLKSRA